MVLHVGKELNIKKVIKFIRENGPISRKEISEKMDIPQPTITRIIEELQQEGIIKELGTVPSHRGRRQVMLALDPKCYYAIGVEIGRNVVHTALVDLDGSMINFKMKEMSKGDKIADVMSYLRETTGQLLQEAKVDDSRLLGVGVGIPGWLHETKEGFISPSNFYGEKKIPLRTLLEEVIPYPVIIDNNANVAALAEKWFGKGRGTTNLIYVLAEIGIGSGIIIRDNLYRGLGGKAGEIAHTTVDIYGELCTCGNYGCLETLVSVLRIVEKMKKKLKVEGRDELRYFAKEIDEIELADIVSACRQGSVLAQKQLEETGTYLGIGISNVIQHFAPDMIIVGGKLGTCHPIIVDEIKRTIEAREAKSSAPKTPIVVSELQEVIVLGAAAQVIDDAFSLYSLL
ncbi:ROK family transcriptional regulator [Paenibacillus thalictri]|uniref:ROK family transcriptional regulator n=1 Tax=Paenibacillus thalictri TaxID=2527873 RepID=A0A4Q9DSR9_9BACL|nr:ROK family transcriptional regulator [Paenibacillus thalictri]TBL79015.1 ROK family transcriptional regulator [Paenibacillus thalictri]